MTQERSILAWLDAIAIVPFVLDDLIVPGEPCGEVATDGVRRRRGLTVWVHEVHRVDHRVAIV